MSAGPAASTWAPLRNGVFRALWLAVLVSNIGAWMQTVGAQWLLVHQPHASILVALVQTADYLPDFMFGLVGGVLADSFDRRRLLMAMQAFLLATGLAAGILERGVATVLGGTKLKLLGDTLFARGLAQENLGDINVQSIAGAVSTGTHGTGVNFGSLSTQLESLTLVTASGDILECSSEKNPDIFKAAQVSLGTLGVIAKVKLRVVPAKRLHYQGYRKRLADCLANLEQYKRENAHFEFFWLPYTEWVQAKFLN